MEKHWLTASEGALKKTCSIVGILQLKIAAFSACFYIETKLMPKLLEAGLVALITPLYYYGMSAQLKIIVDRFYSRTGKITGKKSVLMATAYNSADWTMQALVNHYDTLVRYMKWNDAGKVLAVGCGSRSLIERSNFPEQAYRIGASL